MNTLVLAATAVLMLAFLALTVWASVAWFGKKKLGATYFRALQSTHILYAGVFLIALLFAPNKGKVLEYLLIFVGGGVAYSRALLPGGLMWRILKDPPNLGQGMTMGNGWNFAAVLGYCFFLLSAK